MTIKVTMVAPDEMLPFIVEFSHLKQYFTKKAAVELKNKLQSALDELEQYEAMKEGSMDAVADIADDI
jgi:hypothetical protein